MARRHAGIVLALVASAVAAVGPHAAPARFSLYATIVDDMGAPAVGLTPDDVQVTEGGTVATLERIERLDWPLDVQLLLDNGTGLDAQNIVHLRNGARGFFEALPAGSAVTFVTTSPQPRFLVRSTTSPDELLASVGRLVPDDGTGHLLDALDEATDRIARSGSERFAVIVAVSTLVGDADAQDRILDRVMRRLQSQVTTVHVVQYGGGSQRTASGGANKKEIGLAVARLTDGQYEAISAATRLATLLPELADRIAKSYLDGRVRITVARPDGAKGDPTDVRLATRRGLKASAVSFDARLP